MDKLSVDPFPLVSIGLPVFNGEKYLSKALDSILLQSYKNFELIISDNCSTDETEKICKSYEQKDSRIKYIRQEKNIGSYKNFYFVLKVSKANYFLWAASDDLRSPCWIEKNLNALRECPNAALSCGDVVAVDFMDEVIPHLTYRTNFSLSNNKFLRRLCFWFKYEGFGKANLIYGLYDKKRSSILQVAEKWTRVDGPVGFHHDLAFVYCLLEHGNYVYVPEIVLFKRDHLESEEKELSINRNLFHKMFCPFAAEVLSNYLRHSSSVESVVIQVFTPVKYVFGLILKHVLFLRRLYLTKIRVFLKNS